MARLLIGVPARNEAERIVELADRIEAGASMLGASYDCPLALAYQHERRRHARSVHAATEPDPPGRAAITANRASARARTSSCSCSQALNDGVDFLLLVDADLGGYDPCNLVRVRRRGRAATATRSRAAALVADHTGRATPPTTSRARWSSPVISREDPATARRSHAARTDRSSSGSIVDALPDDYGIDITITLTALDVGRLDRAGRAHAPEHPSKEGNSERVMVEVATAVLGALAKLAGGRPTRRRVARAVLGRVGVAAQRRDRVRSRRRDPAARGSDADLEAWLALGDATDDDVAEMWCDHLADAVRRSSVAPRRSRRASCNDLICPFFVHAEHRVATRTRRSRSSSCTSPTSVSGSRRACTDERNREPGRGARTASRRRGARLHLGAPRTRRRRRARHRRSTREHRRRRGARALGAIVSARPTTPARSSARGSSASSRSDALDQEVWCRTSEVAAALVDLLPSLHVRRGVRARVPERPPRPRRPVRRRAARAPRALTSSSVEWSCYALYALDDRGRPGYGWLHPGLFPDVTDRVVHRRTRSSGSRPRSAPT